MGAISKGVYEMVLGKIMKELEIVEVQGFKITVKKYPLAFNEFMTIKSLEGKDFSQDKKGKVTAINGVGKYDLDFLAQRLFYGLNSWELLDTTDHSLELTLENCLSLAEEYPGLAAEILEKITAFNRPISDDEKKRLD